MSTLKHLTLIVILMALTACSALPGFATPTPLPPTADPTLAQNRQKWDGQHITHYRFNLTVGCFCGFRSQMPLTIEVQDGQVISEVDNTGQPVSQFKEVFEKYNTIEKLFDLANAAQTGDADKVAAEYNAEYGYPQMIYVDYLANAADDEMNYAVDLFEILK